MRLVAWRPPVEPSPAERAAIKAVRRAKLEDDRFELAYAAGMTLRFEAIDTAFGGTSR